MAARLAVMMKGPLLRALNIKAPSGFEPLHKGFADLPLTTWVRRRNHVQKIPKPDWLVYPSPF